MSDEFQQIQLGASNVKEHLTRKEYIVRGLSTFLIIGGLLLISWGVWVPLNNYWVLQNNQAPPLPYGFDQGDEASDSLASYPWSNPDGSDGA